MLSDFTNKELFHLAIDAANQKRSDSTLSYLKELLAREPEHPHASFLIGSTYATLGMFEEAAEHLRKAVDLQPDFSVARFQLGLSLLALNESDKGCEQLTQIISMEAPQSLKYFAEGLLCAQRNEKNQAITILEKGIQLDPDSPISHDMEEVIDALNTMPDERVLADEKESSQPLSISSDANELYSNDFLLGAYKK